MTLQAALAGGEPPIRETSVSVWGRWNGMSPEEQASGFLEWDTRHLEALEGLSQDILAHLKVRISFLPEPVDSVGLVGLRLGEHELHNWDIRVSFDPGATIADSAAELLVDRLPMMMPWIGHGDALVKPPARLAVSTIAPPRRWTLELGQQVALSEPAPGSDGSLEARGESLLRLVTGRIRPDDAARVALTGPIGLADLARVFPGF
jgi:hypothetical protein